MVEYILGNYLVESGKISDEDMNAVLEQMNAVRVKLGLIAVAEGFMTTKQAETVNKLQATCDKRFGDIAVEQGYLTEEQVGKLLEEQGNTYFMFIQTLVDLSLLETEEVDGILEQFKRKKGYTNTELEDIKSDDADRIIPLYLQQNARKYQELLGLAVRTMIRLIDRRLYIGEATVQDSARFQTMVSQKLLGAGCLQVALAEKGGALLTLCSGFGQEDFQKLDEDALDAAGEFINCLNGLYASARSRAGEFMELYPPEYHMSGADVTGVVCTVPINIQGKELYFVVAEPA